MTTDTKDLVEAGYVGDAFPNGPRTALSSSAEAEKARAVQEVQAALVIAKKFPRDEVDAETRILNACKRYSLAERAVYRFPRGGQSVEGPSIRLAEVLARAWGNLNFGFREIEKIHGQSKVEAFCWDLETNTKQTREFTVEHKIQLKNGAAKVLTDPRDQYEIVANQAQRRVRACILGIIPGDIVEHAVKACRATLAKGEKAEPLIDRVKRMVQAFGELGVSQEMLESRLGHKIELTTGEEVADLLSIYNSIRDGQSKRGDWFDFEEKDANDEIARLNEELERKRKRIKQSGEEKKSVEEAAAEAMEGKK